MVGWVVAVPTLGAVGVMVGVAVSLGRTGAVGGAVSLGRTGAVGVAVLPGATRVTVGVALAMLSGVRGSVGLGEPDDCGVGVGVPVRAAIARASRLLLPWADTSGRVVLAASSCRIW